MPARAPSRLALVTTSRPYMIMPNSIIPKRIVKSTGNRSANSAATAPRSFSFRIGYPSAQLLGLYPSRHDRSVELRIRLLETFPIGLHRGCVHFPILAFDRVELFTSRRVQDLLGPHLLVSCSPVRADRRRRTSPDHQAHNHRH